MPASAAAGASAQKSAPHIAAFDKAKYSVDQAASPWVVVNKRRPLNPITYAPANLVTPRFDDGAGQNPMGAQLAKPAAKAIKLMATAMRAEGAGVLIIQSGYRSYPTQVAVHSKDVAKFGLTVGENLAARPGYSEHQTGLAVDVSALGQGCRIYPCFATTKAGAWLAANSWKYGFILRYPNGLTTVTGYQFEPWHFRYVGIELSTQLHSTGFKTLERFFGLPDAPGY
ncbi:MAG: D-alanyl-D-alanine carboxypeptidase family protein [Micrococcales bacterium]